MGARYTKDKREFDSNALDRLTNGSEVCLYTLNGLSAVPEFSPPCTIKQKAIFNKTTYTVSLNYQLDPDKLVYARTSSGYRAGGFNSEINSPETLRAFAPEVVTDYELGLKADWLERRLRTNIAAFHSKGRQVQQTVNGTSATGELITVVENIGTRTVDGVEAEIIGRPTHDLTLDASLTYLDARLNNPADPVHFANVVLTPRWAYNLGGTYDHEFSSDFTGTLRVDLSYRSKMYDQNPLVDPSTGAVAYQGFYRPVTLLSARYTLKHAPSGIELAIYGRNLTNQSYEARAAVISGLGLAIANLAEPRAIGVEVKVPFGGR
jgi:iron complex outermembrane receptor protein